MEPGRPLWGKATGCTLRKPYTPQEGCCQEVPTSLPVSVNTLGSLHHVCDHHTYYHVTDQRVSAACPQLHDPHGPVLCPASEDPRLVSEDQPLIHSNHSIPGIPASVPPFPLQSSSSSLASHHPLVKDGLTGLGASRNFSSAILRLDLYVSLSGSSSRAFL